MQSNLQRRICLRYPYNKKEIGSFLRCKLGWLTCFSSSCFFPLLIFVCFLFLCCNFFKFKINKKSVGAWPLLFHQKRITLELKNNVAVVSISNSMDLLVCQGIVVVCWSVDSFVGGGSVVYFFLCANLRQIFWKWRSTLERTLCSSRPLIVILKQHRGLGHNSTPLHSCNQTPWAIDSMCGRTHEAEIASNVCL
jgi:hypothetical protein